MSGEGLRIFNEAGAPQANSDIFPLGISEANNLTLVDDGGTHPQPMVTGSITVTGTNPVVAFLPPVGVYISEDRVSNSGSSFTFYFRAKSYNAINMAYWVFDVPTRALKDPTLSAAGIRAYDQNGVLSFDAATSNFRIVGFLDPSVPTNTTPGEGMLHESTSEITVPPGKTYALVQSEYLYSATMWDMGQYSELPGGQIDLPEGEPGLIPPNAQYKTMQLESYYLAGGRSDANTLVAGVKQFEHFQGWYPIGQTEHIEINGSTGHTVIDVSNFVGGGTVNPGVISVNVDNLERNATGPGGSTTLSNYVNLSISGGTAPYTITWQKVPGGATEVVNDSALNATSFRTKVVSQPANTVYTAKWRANVVDSNGLTGSGPEVTFTHSAVLVDDYITDPITPFTVFNVSSTEHDVSWDGSLRQITGINKPITLRFERYNYTGNLSGLYLDIFTAPAPSGPWTHHGYFNAHDTGTRYLDVAGVVNGTWIAYNAHAVTTSGRREGNCNISIWNLTAPGGPVKISDVNNNNFIVDSDNNYNNADFTPDPMNWNNISLNTTATSGFVGTNAPIVSGINRTVRLRATMSNVIGNTNGTLEAFVNNVKEGDSSGIGNGFWTRATVVNGSQVQWIAHASATSTASGSYTVTVTNEETQEVVDTFTVNTTVGPAPPDYTPNPISLTDQTLIIDHWEGYTSGTFFQITGINQPITIRIARGTTTDSPGRSGSRRLIIGKSTNGGASYVETPMGAASAPLDFTANNGDWFFLKGYFDTTSGRGTSSWTTTVTNATTGTVLGSCLVSGTVDNDNNYNVSDPTMNAVSMGSIGLLTNDPSGYTNDQYINISGINVPINLQFTRTGVGTGMTITPNIIYSRQYIYHSTNNWASWTEYLLTAASGSVTNITVNNGDSIIIRGYIETSGGQASASWYTDVNNTTGSQYIGRCYLSGTVDNDDNYNVSPLTVNVGNSYSYQHDYVQSGQYYGISAGPSVTVSGGTPPYSYSWVRTYHDGSPITISSTTIANPTFSAYALTSWRVYAEYSLTVTDSKGRVQTQGFTVDWSAGDIAT